MVHKVVLHVCAFLFHIEYEILVINKTICRRRFLLQFLSKAYFLYCTDQLHLFLTRSTVTVQFPFQPLLRFTPTYSPSSNTYPNESSLDT